MRNRSLYLLIILLTFSACEVYMAPSEYWRKAFSTQTDSEYYQSKAKELVSKVIGVAGEYDINKVGVMDFVDEGGKVSVLGEYMAARVTAEVAAKRPLRVAQQGEIKDLLARLGLPPSQLYSKNDVRKIGEGLGSQALMTGKLTDLGTNIDVLVTMIDVASGEVIASATASLTRTKFAVEMLRHY